MARSREIWKARLWRNFTRGLPGLALFSRFRESLERGACGCVCWIQTHRFRKVCDGLVDLPLLVEDKREVGVRIAEAGIDAQRFPEVALRLGILPLHRQDDPE